MTLHCLWCRKPFEPRRGGRRQRYCSSECRRTLDRAIRTWAGKMLEAGLLPVGFLRTYLMDNARIDPDGQSISPISDNSEGGLES